ncbi:aggregation-promoting factor [Lactobacillus hominis]|uniref:Apf1 n=2 Tax=Lactobacillus hominis TaxID=1203033 RepID=I7IVV5_9LACO|nr:Apf1 [Lactobacillus hominis DSM 23910 = CRBIP 24.179]
MKNFKSINFKSVLVKSIMAAGVSFAGLFTLNNLNSNSTVHAATTANDPKVVTVNYVPGYGIAVWNGTDNNAHTTGQKLAHATSWKVTDSKYDAQGNKWYDLGLDQWVMAKWTRNGLHTVDENVRFDYVAPTTTQAPVAQNQTTTYANNNASSYNYSAQNTQSYQPARSYSNYTSNATGSEASAKAWIAARESGGSYSARNGQYIGKYQLSASYLNGDYSAANQERVADNYVKSRYGSWANAQSFWQANGWY